MATDDRRDDRRRDREGDRRRDREGDRRRDREGGRRRDREGDHRPRDRDGDRRSKPWRWQFFSFNCIFIISSSEENTNSKTPSYIHGFFLFVFRTWYGLRWSRNEAQSDVNKTVDGIFIPDKKMSCLSRQQFFLKSHKDYRLSSGIGGAIYRWQSLI